MSLTVFCAGSHAAPQMDFSVDLRVSYSDGQQSFLDGGLGKLRTDEDHDGLHLGRIRAAIGQPLGESFFVRVDASAWGNDDHNPIDLTEAYLEYRPIPQSAWRTRVRAGAFYPPLSLENRAGGWESPYTLSSSAINTWIGEEIRTVGLEARLDWLGSRLGHTLDVELVGGVFGWNDPAGVLVASHGFALHDRQTTMFGYIGARGSPAQPRRELFHEIDDRAGFHIGGEIRYLDRLTLNVLHYDNNADCAVYDAELDDFAWLTLFDAAGARLETDRGWTFIAQWLEGQTTIQPLPEPFDWYFDSWFALLSRQFGPHMLSVRYDDFSVEAEPAWLTGTEDGHALTAAYVFEPNDTWRVTLEWLKVSSDSRSRMTLFGAPAYASEHKLELAIRYAVDATSRGRRASGSAHSNPASPSAPNVHNIGM